MFRSEVVRAGLHTTHSDAIAGWQIQVTGLTAAGSTQGTALALALAHINIITTAAASTGVILPTTPDNGDTMVVVNGGANALAVYPPVGHTILGLAANAALSLGIGKSGSFQRVGATSWVGIGSA